MGSTRRLSGALVGLLALALHLRTVTYGFLFDDHALVVGNWFLPQPWSAFRAFAHDFWFGSEFYGYYRPIVTATLAMNGRLSGWNPAGFHLFNVLLHALNSVLIFALVRRRTAAAWAGLCAVIFAAHPAAAWPVASIVARVDLLPATFILLAWLMYESRDRGPDRGANADLRYGHWALGGIFFLLALLSKESALAFIVVPFMGLWSESRPAVPGAATGSGPPRDRMPSGSYRGALAFCIVTLGALGAYVLIRRAAGVPIAIDPKAVDPLVNPLASMPWPGRFYAALGLSLRYILYLLVPLRFSDPRGYGPFASPPAWSEPQVILSAGLLLLWGLGVLVLWLRRERAAVPLAFALASFLPASNLLMSIGSLYAQNFLYLPLIGITLAFGDLIGRAAQSAGSTAQSSEGAGQALRRYRIRIPVMGAAVVAGALLAWGSFQEAGIWRDAPTLFSAWTSRFPNYALAHYRKGLSLIEIGRPAEAVGPLRKALSLENRNEETYDKLSMALMLSARNNSDLEESLEKNRVAVAIMVRRLAEARTWATMLLLDLGKDSEAEAEAREAHRLMPDYVPARSALAETLFREKKYPEAAIEFKELVRLKPDDPDVFSPYVVSLIHSGDLAEARIRAEEGRKRFPQLAWFDFCLARVEARSGHRQEALNLLKSCVARDPATREWLRNVDDFAALKGDPAYDSIMN